MNRPTGADPLTAVTAEAARHEEGAQEALWRLPPDIEGYRRLMSQARKAYEAKRVLWARRHPYTSERKAREQREPEPARRGGGVPVYDEAGTLFAPSVHAAARMVGSASPQALRPYLAPHADGWRLTGRPALRTREAA